MTDRSAPRPLLLLQAAAVVAVWLLAGDARAQTLQDEPGRSLDSAVLSGGGAAPASGSINVNAVAGVGNQQANAVVMSIGRSAAAAGLVIQNIDPPAPKPAEAADGLEPDGGQTASPAGGEDIPTDVAALEGDDVLPRDRVAGIEGGAFAGASGVIAVNVAAGADNQQANVAAIAIGIRGPAAADALLSQTRAAPEPEGAQDESTPRGDIATDLGDGAFAGASGLVQLSLLGGERNSSANTFALSVVGRGGE